MNDKSIRAVAAGVLERAVAAKEVAGANVLVLRDGKTLFSLQSGYADIENQKPMAQDSILRLYSMSKPITGAAVMLLFERGLIDLTDPICKYLPGFSDQTCLADGREVPVPRQTTIHDLLFMTSGLSYGGDSVAGQAAFRVFEELIDRMDGDNPMTTLEFANRVGKNPLEFAPYSHFMYGTSADVLGAVVEVVSGLSFGQFLERELFEPLEMPDTGFYVPADKQHRLSNVYRRTGQGFERFTYHHLGINIAMDCPPAFESGGAGLVSTLGDYAHFASMLLSGGCYKGRQILQPATVRYFTTGSLQPWQQEDLARNWGGLEGYSYGNLMRVMKDPSLAIMQTTMGEYGWDGWLGPYFSNHPDIGLTILVGMQLTDAGTTPVVRKLRNVILSGAATL